MTNNVKSCKKIDERGQTAKFTVFASGSQLRGAENMENWGKRELLKIFKYYTISRVPPLKN